MAVEIVMPRLGWTMEVGTLVEWTKKHGEQIEAGEIVMLVESDKAVNEVEVFDTGILHIPPHSPAVGSAVPVGTPMAYILEPGEEPPAPTCSDLVAPNPAAAVPELATPSTTPQVAVQRQPSPAQPAAGKRSRREGPTISPRARRIAVELGVDWHALRGSGRTGRIVESDVRRGGAQAPPGRLAAFPASVAVEADATQFLHLHEKLSTSRNVTAEEAPTIADLLVKLTAVALAQHEDAGIAPGGDDGSIEVSPALHVGTGLAYPVIRDAAAKSLRQIAAESRGFRELDRELIGAGGEASFTVIDMGPYGVDSFQPPLIPGQRAALAVGRTVSRPGDGGSQQYLTLSLTYDPQKLDGIAVSSFLSTVRDFIQEPFQWLTW